MPTLSTFIPLTAELFFRVIVVEQVSKHSKYP